jgi:hypothetical protein
MSKKLRNLALLGGLGAAAAMAMRSKGKEEESKDTTGDASAGMAKDRLSDFRGKSGEADRDVGAAVKRATAPAAKPAAPAAKPAAPAAKPAAPSRMTGGKSGDADKDINIPDRAKSPATTRQGRRIAEISETFSNPAGSPDTKPRVIGSYGDAARSATTLGFSTPNRVERRGYKSGGSVGSASKRADGIAIKGKTKGRMI